MNLLRLERRGPGAEIVVDVVAPSDAEQGPAVAVLLEKPTTPTRHGSLS